MKNIIIIIIIIKLLCKRNTDIPSLTLETNSIIYIYMYFVCVCVCVCVDIDIRRVPGGMCQASGGVSLC